MIPDLLNDDNMVPRCGETVVLRDENGVHTFMNCDREKGHTGQCSHDGHVEESP